MPTSGTDRTISFQLKNGVEIDGGYAGDANSDPNARDISLYPSILSGDIGATGESTDNSYHVVVGSNTNSTAISDGFTITGGYANGATSSNYYGGGVYCYSGSPTFRSCTIKWNSAIGAFGVPDARGGGMYLAISSSILANCAFSGNSVNGTSVYGGGLYTDSFYGPPALTNCTFSGNSANGTALAYGGGMYNGDSATLTNCTFSGNSAKHAGGAIYHGNTISPLTLTNCVIWGNFAPGGAQIDQVPGTTVTVTYSDVQGSFAGTGNINADPLFVRRPNPGSDGSWSTADDDYGDLRLHACSPAADAGNNDAPRLVGITTDLGGGSRFLDIPTTTHPGVGTPPIVDMGAYEAMAALSASAGGQYTVAQGQSLALCGHGASAISGALQYAWDLDADGAFDDAAIASPLFDTAGKPLSTLTVSLRVTDAAMQSIVSATTIRIVPAVLFVDQSVTGGDGSGASWTNALTDLQAGLAQAVPGQQLHVAAGTYKPTSTKDALISFRLKNGVSLLGGYAGSAGPNPDTRNVALYPSILSGDIGTTGYAYDNSYHVLVASGTDSTAVMDGFTITGGHASGGAGGGLYSFRGSPTLRNCTFSANWAGTYGGGMYNYSSSPALSNCTFSANSAGSSSDGYGGGMYNFSSSSPTLVDCVFTGNTAAGSGAFGAGMYNSSSAPALTRCTFNANSITGLGIAKFGGGMYNTGSSPTLNNCTFIANSVSRWGGGMYNTSSSPTLIGCTFTGNSASQGAGGMLNNASSPKLTNCTFSGNSSGTSGGGMISQALSAPVLTNCTFSGNAAVGTGCAGGAMFNGTGLVTLTNCILWGNTAATNAQIYQGEGTTTASYSDIQGGWVGAGNIDIDPVFVRSLSPGDYGDLRLQFASPCIDVGNNSAVLSGITTDAAGSTRILDYPGIHDPGAIVDIGAYERRIPVTIGGTAGNDPFYISLSSDGSLLEIWNALTPCVSPLADLRQLLR